MRSLRLLQLLFFNSLLLSVVPGQMRAAFEAPEPIPISFALANLASFSPEQVFSSTVPAKLHVSAGGARLYGMPEIQPFCFRAALRSPGGWACLRGGGLSSGAYREIAAGLSYELLLPESLAVQLELEILQVAIEDYDDAWSKQFNARLQWAPNRMFALAAMAMNVTGSNFGQGGYPLPRRIIIGGRASPYPMLSFFIEMDQDMRYDLSPRFGAVFSPLERITLLAALQSDPNIISFGLSGLIGAVRATLAYQYHPDLGFSQCYGLAVAF